MGRELRARLMLGSCLVAAVLVATVAACGDDGRIVHVSAAASLGAAFEELADEFEQRNPGSTVRLNLAGSSTLREQLLDGAPADVFASANMAVMQDLVDAGEVTAGAPAAMASNRLVLAVESGNPHGLTTLAELADDSLLVGVCAEGVPCGDLALQWLEDESVRASLDTAEPDARALTRRLIEGELDTALVYASDVASAGGAIEAVASAGVGPATTYPIVAVSDDGAAFVEFVLSDDGRATLARWGFGAP